MGLKVKEKSSKKENRKRKRQRKKIDKNTIKTYGGDI